MIDLHSFPSTGRLQRPRALLITLAGAGALIAACGSSQRPAKAAGPPASMPASAPAKTIAASDGGGPGSGTRDFSTVLARSELRERAVDLLTQAAASREALVRANAIEGLQSAPSRAEPAVRAGLVDENPGVRFVAAMTVAQLRMKDSAPFVEPLLQDSDPRVRASAVLALTRAGRHPDPTVLGDMLQNPDSRVRSEAARVLGEMGNTSAVPMLRAAAAASINFAAAPAAATGDAATGDVSPVVGPQFQLEKAFQLQVAEALVKLGETQAGDSLRAALYPSSREGFESATLAAQILGGLKDAKAVAQLVELVEQTVPGSAKGPDPKTWTFIQPRELRLAAATALARMGYPGGVYVGDMYAKDSDPLIRAHVAILYGWTGQAVLLGRLAPMMDDPSELVRVAAAAGVLRIVDRPRG